MFDILLCNAICPFGTWKGIYTIPQRSKAQFIAFECKKIYYANEVNISPISLASKSFTDFKIK